MRKIVQQIGLAKSFVPSSTMTCLKKWNLWYPSMFEKFFFKLLNDFIFLGANVVKEQKKLLKI